MGERSKGRLTGPMNRIILKTASSSKIRTRLKQKLPNEPKSCHGGKHVNQPLTTKLSQTGPKNEPILSRRLVAPKSDGGGSLGEGGSQRILDPRFRSTAKNAKSTKIGRLVCPFALFAFSAVDFVRLSTHYLSTYYARHKCQPIPTLAWGCVPLKLDVGCSMSCRAEVGRRRMVVGCSAPCRRLIRGRQTQSHQVQAEIFQPKVGRPKIAVAFTRFFDSLLGLSGSAGEGNGLKFLRSCECGVAIKTQKTIPCSAGCSEM
jgi:hypothetical protein